MPQALFGFVVAICSAMPLASSNAPLYDRCVSLFHPHEDDLETLADVRLIVDAKQRPSPRIMDQVVRGTRIAHILEFDEYLCRRPLFGSLGAGDMNGSRIEIACVQSALVIDTPDVDDVSAIRPNPSPNELLEIIHALRRWFRT